MPKVHGKIDLGDGKYDADRDTFIKEVSVETGFTIADTRIFVDAVQKVFEKAILNGMPLSIRGLGHLTFSTVAPRRGFNASAYKNAFKENPEANKDDFYQEFPEAIRMNFQLSQNLRDLLRSEDKKKIKKNNE
jgi:nucleoid DNA-binding protein